MRAAACAVSLLLRQRLYSPRVNVLKLRFEQRIVFDTFAHYCTVSRMTLPVIQKYADMRDGCTIARAYGNGKVYVVLYNGDIAHPGRRNFTLAHEVGHILLEHENDGSDEEAEANHFAAQLLLPPVLVWELLTQTDFNLSASELAGIFAVSEAAAQNRLRSLFQNRPSAFTGDECLLLKKCAGLLPDLSGPVVDI